MFFCFTSCEQNENQGNNNLANAKNAIIQGESISSTEKRISGRELMDKMGESLKMSAIIKGTILSVEKLEDVDQVYIDMGDGSSMQLQMGSNIHLPMVDLVGKTIVAKGTSYIDISNINEKLNHDPDDLNKPDNNNVVSGDESEPDIKFIVSGIIIK
ncbi:MAG: hypothetical protein SGJ04_09410 [Bacteroidota bacterium]|nr:hypothetical protein [Bacteroidota bacterium]